MTEDQSERIVERRMNRLDKLLLNGSIDQSDYDELVKAIEFETFDDQLGATLDKELNT